MKEFELDYSDIPHDAGQEETKGERDISPVLERDCLRVKTYKSVRQGNPVQTPREKILELMGDGVYLV